MRRHIGPCEASGGISRRLMKIHRAHEISWCPTRPNPEMPHGVSREISWKLVTSHAKARQTAYWEVRRLMRAHETS